MKALVNIALLSIVILWLSGCSTIQTIKAQYPLDHQLAKGEVTQKSAYYEIESGDDDSIRSLFWVIATEGKKYGAKYFSIQEPAVWRSGLGSPFTTVDEALSYCEKNTFGGLRPKCVGLSMSPNIAVKFYSENTQPDLLLWNIDDVLKDKKVDSGKINYELEIFPKKDSKNIFRTITAGNEMENKINMDFADIKDTK